MKTRAGLLRTIGGFAAAGLLALIIPIAANAAGKATVIATDGANVRSSASASSTIVGSALRNQTLEVISSETDANGQIWYKVKLSDSVSGFIRGDLVTVEGVDSSAASTTTTTSTAPAVDASGVTEAEPVSGKISVSGFDLNVREGASTNHKIIDSLKNGSVVTVIGYTTASNGSKWYKVSYTSNTAQVTGFVSADYVKLDGELKEKQPEPEPEPEPVPEPTPEPEPEPEPETVYKDFEAVYDAAEDVWYLNDYTAGTHMKISALYNAKDNYDKLLADSTSSLKKKNTAIIILSFLLVACIAASAYGYTRFKKWFTGEDEGEDPMGRRILSGANKTYSPADTHRSARINADLTSHRVGGDRETSSRTGAPDPVKAQLPEGAVRLPDGRIQMPDGSIKKVVMGRKLPDGSIELPDGRIRKPDGTIIRLDSQDTDTILSRAGNSSHEVKEIKTNNSLSDDDDMEFGFLNVKNGSSN